MALSIGHDVRSLVHAPALEAAGAGCRDREGAVDRLADDRRRSLAARHDGELPRVDARRVEEVGEQAAHARRASLDPLDQDPLGALDHLAKAARAHRDRVERAPQVVRDDRQDVVARPGRVLRLLEEAGLVDRDGRALGELPERRFVVAPERTAGRPAHRDRPEGRVVVADERGVEPRNPGGPRRLDRRELPVERHAELRAGAGRLEVDDGDVGEDEDAGLTRSDLEHLRDRSGGVDAEAGGGEVLELQGLALDLGVRRPLGPLGARHAQCAPDARCEHRGGHVGLRDVVRCAALHQLDCQLPVAASRQDDDRRRRGCACHGLDDVGPVAAGQAVVDEDAVELALGEDAARRCDVGGLDDLDVEVRLVEGAPDGGAIDLVVIDEQDPDRRRSPGVHASSTSVQYRWIADMTSTNVANVTGFSM